MVSKYGMSDVIGPAAFAVERNSFGNEVYSAELASKIDNEIAKLIENAKKMATDTIVKHRGALDAIANELISVETLEREAFEKILILNQIAPKKREESYSNEGVIIAENLKAHE
jgi:cell division protease FtsH